MTGARGSRHGGAMKASDLLVRCLENEGVRYVFGLPGEETLDILDSLSHSQQIRFVTCRHEQGAAVRAPRPSTCWTPSASPDDDILVT